MANIPKNTNKRSRSMADHETLQNSGHGEDGCSLQQITMFDCDKESMETKGIVKCYPIPRVFRVCKNRPAVEVTALLQYKDDTGDPVLPKDYLSRLPKGETWNPIISQ